MSEYAVVLFHTTSAALKAEKVLKKAGIEVKAIPVPRQFSSDCGISVRFPASQADEVEHLLNAKCVETAGIHQLPAE